MTQKRELNLEPTDAIIKKFWASVKRGHGCWTFTGTINHNGYGKFYVGNYRHERAHRFSWLLEFGVIAPGVFVLHKCDNRACVRPDHLFTGTQRDNLEDMTLKGRRRDAVGVDASCSKVTEDDVRNLRANYVPGTSRHNPGNLRILAGQLGISKQAALAIIHRKNWRHVL